MIGTALGPIQQTPDQAPELPPAFIGAVVAAYLPVLWVSIALLVKRGHDRGRSGWWQLLNIVPFANIWLFIDQAFLRGVDESNQWGPPAVPREPMV